MTISKIGILTGGGDCPGLNAVIRGVVKSAIIRHGWQVIGIEDGFDGLLDLNKCKPLTLESVRGILPRGGTILGTTNRGNPFDYPVEQDGKIIHMDISDRVVENIRTLGIEALIAVGGDGSLKIALELAKKGVPVVGVPKTIDNDLRETDFTFGYNTALETATDALDKLHTTAESHHRVMILEVMGRYAGWIALESGIAGGADVILIPEIPFDVGKICAAVRERAARGSRFSIVVAAEGAFPAGGGRVVAKAADERYTIERLGGIGHFLISADITGWGWGSIAGTRVPYSPWEMHSDAGRTRWTWLTPTATTADFEALSQSRPTIWPLLAPDVALCEG